ncbi:MAG: FAD-binding oxidoreductase [Gemmatimonadota bacterium]|nr:MAG: FAD-binding oxidoreductase [Gemmatimonadota bacterium]
MAPSVPETREIPERTDVVVVGGGIAGTSAAYHLARAGIDVVLLERGRIGSGATAAAVGVLSPPLRQPFHETVHFLGQASAYTLWHFASRSIATLGALLESRGEAERAGLDLSGGHVLAEPHTAHEVRRSFEALETAGIDVQWITPDDIRSTIGGQGFAGGFRIEGGGGLNPGPTAVAVGRAAADEGALIGEDLDVLEAHRVQGGFRCEAGPHSVLCSSVVYATHVESARFSNLVRREIVPIRGQGFATRSLESTFSGGYSTHWKLNVWRQASNGQIVAGGWRHDAWDRAYRQSDADIDEHLQRDIRQWFETSFPKTRPLALKDRWSGVFGWTADFLPMVGELPGHPGEYIISGFSGGGLPFAFECGRIISTLISGEPPIEGTEILTPKRFSAAQ